MRTHASECSAVSPCAPTRLDGLKEHFLFRIAVFTLSVAGGYYFTRWVCSVVHLLPFWTHLAHEKANPAADALRTLHSGFGD
jgi:hypothetical protein